MSRNVGVRRHALVDSDDIDISDDESVTEDDTTDTTLGVDMRNGEDRLGDTGDLPKLRG